MQSIVERAGGRAWDELRKIEVVPDFIGTAAGSCYIQCGRTRIICTATIDDKTPSFLENTGMGWLSAEYSMLPASTSVRISRERAMGSGRSQEIQRLIGRSLRMCLDRKVLGPRTITIDCDVIEADGGTRTAAINGGYIAMCLAINKLRLDNRIEENPVIRSVAAVSLGIVHGRELLDLDFVEDSSADIDANLVASPGNGIVEWQCTAERAPLPQAQIATLVELGMKGINAISQQQATILLESNNAAWKAQ
ncbi:MAG: ribonuclease PH [Bradymonadia bacterium]|jgi:ribonuclease PH